MPTFLVLKFFAPCSRPWSGTNFNEKRSNKLRDFILDDQSLLVELIGSADLEVIKDLTRGLAIVALL